MPWCESCLTLFLVCITALLDVDKLTCVLVLSTEPNLALSIKPRE